MRFLPQEIRAYIRQQRALGNDRFQVAVERKQRHEERGRRQLTLLNYLISSQFAKVRVESRCGRSIITRSHDRDGAWVPTPDLPETPEQLLECGSRMIRPG